MNRMVAMWTVVLSAAMQSGVAQADAGLSSVGDAKLPDGQTVVITGSRIPTPRSSAPAAVMTMISNRQSGRYAFASERDVPDGVEILAGSDTTATEKRADPAAKDDSKNDDCSKTGNPVLLATGENIRTNPTSPLQVSTG